MVDGVLELTGSNTSSIENSPPSVFAAKGIDGGIALLNRQVVLCDTTSPDQPSTTKINDVIRIATIDYILTSFLNRVLIDLLFTCTTQTVATAVQLADRQRIWRYQYDATLPNLQLFPNAGAYYTAEIPSARGTYDTTNEFGTVTPTQIPLSSYM